MANLPLCSDDELRVIAELVESFGRTRRREPLFFSTPAPPPKPQEDRALMLREEFTR